MFDEVYILFHFNIIFKHGGVSSTKVKNNFNFILKSLKPFDLSACPEVRTPPTSHMVSLVPITFAETESSEA